MLEELHCSDYDDLPFAERGEDVVLCPHLVFVWPERIHLKNRILISEFGWLQGGRILVIGNFIHIAPFVSIAGGGAVIMDDFTSIAAGGCLIGGSDDLHGKALVNPTIPARLRGVKRSYIHMKKHAVIATNATVLPGVTLGEGAVLGANSVATKDLDPWTIYTGIPARPVADRGQAKMHELENKAYEDTGIAPWNSIKIQQQYKSVAKDS